MLVCDCILQPRTLPSHLGWREGGIPHWLGDRGNGRQTGCAVSFWDTAQGKVASVTASRL